MIYLIRHGETEANLRHLYCGSTDLPLSEQGMLKLHRQKDFPISKTRFITSGMLRTEQTLNLLFGDVPHQKDSRFREIDFGIFEMHSYEELKSTPTYQKWITGNNEANVCPGGESGEQMRARALTAFSELATQAPSQNIVIVTHGGVIAAIMDNLFSSEGKSRFQWQPSPGNGYVIDIEAMSYSKWVVSVEKPKI